MEEEGGNESIIDVLLSREVWLRMSGSIAVSGCCRMRVGMSGWSIG